jgi:hypothetical protein
MKCEDDYCLPQSYPDELLYSICARYSDRMQYPSSKSASQELLGSAKAYPIIDLPSRLNILIAALPPGHGYVVKQLIDNHTLLPFYSPFPPTRASGASAAGYGKRQGTFGSDALWNCR